MPKQPVLYETMYIVDSALEESAVQEIVTTLEEFVRSSGGEVVATREFGRRRLAYEIDGHTSGTYMVLYFKSHGDLVPEVMHEMHLIEGIVRGIVVVANPKALFEPQAKAEAAEAPAAEAPAPAEEPVAVEAAAEEPAAEAVEAVAEEPAAEAVAAVAEEPAAEEAPVVEEAPAAEAEEPAADAGEAEKADEAATEEA